MNKRMSSAAVNRALAAAGHAERLYRGKGYWYFANGSTPYWRDTMVCTPFVSDLTVEHWLAEHARLKADAERHYGGELPNETQEG